MSYIAKNCGAGTGRGAPQACQRCLTGKNAYITKGRRLLNLILESVEAEGAICRREHVIAVKPLLFSLSCSYQPVDSASK
jgi:hypothetical protein